MMQDTKAEQTSAGGCKLQFFGERVGDRYSKGCCIQREYYCTGNLARAIVGDMQVDLSSVRSTELVGLAAVYFDKVDQLGEHSLGWGIVECLDTVVAAVAAAAVAVE